MGTTAELSRIAYPGKEQRLSARKRVSQPIPIDLAPGQKVWLYDVGEAGVGVSGTTHLESGTRAKVQFRFPDTDASISADGIVAWSDAFGRSGIHFAEIQPNVCATLRNWLASGSTVTPLETGEAVQHDSALAAQISCLGEIADLQAAISAQRLDRDAALDLIVRRMAELTRASGAAIALREQQDVICRASFGNAPDVGVKLSATSLSGECLRSGNLVQLHDSETDSRVDPEIYRQLNFRSLLILPVVAGSNRIGIAEVLSSNPRNFKGGDILVISLLADLIATIAALPADAEASEPPDGIVFVGIEDVPATVNDTLEEGASSLPAYQDFVDNWISETSATAESGTDVPLQVSKEGLPSAPPAVEDSVPQGAEAPPSASPLQAAGAQRKTAAAVLAIERAAPAAIRLQPRRKRFHAVPVGLAGAVLLALAVWLTSYVLHRSAAHVAGTNAIPAGTSMGTQPPVTSSSPAAPASAPTSVVANAPVPKSSKPSPRVALGRSSSRSNSAVEHELEVIQTNRTSMQQPATTEAAPDAPAISQLSSRSAGELPAAIIAAKTPTPGLGLLQSQGVVEGKLIKKILPRYPEMARHAGVTGDVVLSGTIGTDGRLKNLKVLSGSPMLREEALAAARQWQYSPYMLGGKAVETETHITISFHR